MGIRFNVVNGVNSVSFGNELALLNAETGEYFVINEIGSIIFQYLKENMSLAEIVDELIKIYEVDFELCLSEVEIFTAKLVSDKVISRKD